jgi:hypothetical protein
MGFFFLDDRVTVTGIRSGGPRIFNWPPFFDARAGVSPRWPRFGIAALAHRMLNQSIIRGMPEFLVQNVFLCVAISRQSLLELIRN